MIKLWKCLTKIFIEVARLHFRLSRTELNSSMSNNRQSLRLCQYLMNGCCLPEHPLTPVLLADVQFDASTASTQLVLCKQLCCRLKPCQAPTVQNAKVL